MKNTMHNLETNTPSHLEVHNAWLLIQGAQLGVCHHRRDLGLQADNGRHTHLSHWPVLLHHHTVRCCTVRAACLLLTASCSSAQNARVTRVGTRFLAANVSCTELYNTHAAHLALSRQQADADKLGHPNKIHVEAGKLEGTMCPYQG